MQPNNYDVKDGNVNNTSIKYVDEIGDSKIDMDNYFKEFLSNGESLQSSNNEGIKNDFSILLGDKNTNTEYNVVDSETQNKLESLYQQKELVQTGVIVTDRIPTNLVDSAKAKIFEDLYQQGSLVSNKTTYCLIGNTGNIMANHGPYDEFEYEGEKYVRHISDREVPLMNNDGVTIKKGDVCYFEVEPLEKLYGSIIASGISPGKSK